MPVNNKDENNLIVLGIESSCDETAVAIISESEGLLANKLYSQTELHSPYGGVVPELASRDHIRKLGPLVQETLKAANIELGNCLHLWTGFNGCSHGRGWLCKEFGMVSQ